MSRLSDYELLYNAIETGNSNQVLDLLQAGINVNAELDEDGRTALMLAVQMERFEIVRVLIGTNANVNQLSYDSDFALLIAAVEGYQEIFDYLAPLTSTELKAIAERELSKGIQRQQKKLDQLSDSFVQGDIHDIQSALSRGIDINTISAEGYTALWNACHAGNKSKVQALIQSGANVNLSSESGWTPLMIAVSRGLSSQEREKKRYFDTVKLLIQAGADVNIPNQKGRTPLMEAVASGNIDITETLIQAGANVNAVDGKERSVLWYAQLGKNLNIIQMLQGLGAKEN